MIVGYLRGRERPFERDAYDPITCEGFCRYGFFKKILYIVTQYERSL